LNQTGKKIRITIGLVRFDFEQIERTAEYTYEELLGKLKLEIVR